MSVMYPVYRDLDEANRKIIMLIKQIDELKKSQAWGVFHFTKEELAIRDLEKEADGAIDAYIAAAKWALGSQYDEQVVTNRAHLYVEQLKELKG